MQTFDKACILAVDDTADNLQLIHAVLAKDYSLRAATSGEKALAMLDQGLEPDLILLDVMMPGIDGFETCRRLKQHPRSAQIPVIFISAKNEVIDEQTGFELGAVDYISKPISPAILKVRIANQLALANQARQLQQLVKLRTRELEQTRHKIINRLGRAAEYRDNETGLHVQRMSHYCRVLARQLGASESWVELLFNAAPMHDIGKIGIPDHILLKPGKLTPEEYRIMQGHTKIGADILGMMPHLCCNWRRKWPAATTNAGMAVATPRFAGQCHSPQRPYSRHCRCVRRPDLGAALQERLEQSGSLCLPQEGGRRPVRPTVGGSLLCLRS